MTESLQYLLIILYLDLLKIAKTRFYKKICLQILA